MEPSLTSVRQLLSIHPRRLRATAGRPLSPASGLVLLVARKTDAAALADHPRIRSVVVRRRLAEHSLAAVRRPDAARPDLAVRDDSPEAFCIRCDHRGLFARANSAAGLRHARRVVAELLAARRQTLPPFVLQDAPAMEIRAVMVDVSRSCVEKLSYLRGLIDRLAAYRCNQLQLYFEERLAFTKHPQLAHPMAFTLDQMDSLGRYAKARGVDLVPQFATFGHCQGFLQVPAYRKLADGDQIYQLDPLHRGARRMLADMFADWASVAHSPYFHAAFDEAPYFGNTPRTRQFIRAHGVEGFMAHHLNWIHRKLADLGFRTMIWGDMLKHYPKTLDLIGKDLIIVEWHYDRIAPEHERAIRMYRSKGFEVMVAPAASRSAQIHFPQRSQITRNIPDFIRLGLKMGVKGVLTCQWECLPRFSRWSEPGFALACRLAWEGRTGDLRAKREAVCGELLRRDGATTDRVLEHLSPDLLSKRFRRLHSDRDVKVKTYHLDNHEIYATDPLIYLRYGASAWSKRVAARYAKGADLALTTFTGDGPVDRLMRFSAKGCLFIGYKRTKINEAGRWIRKAAAAHATGDRRRCAELLKAALSPVEQLGDLAAELARTAKRVWSLERRGDDPTFEWMYGKRFGMAARGCARLAREIRRCLQSVLRGGGFTLTEYIAGRDVYRFRIGLRAKTGINIVNLNVHLSEDRKTWRYDRRIGSFQPAGSEYDYLWMPIEPIARFIKVDVTRTQAAWTPKDLEIAVYRPPAPTESRRRGVEVIDTEEYYLVRRDDVDYRRISCTKTSAVFARKESD